jgi:hypothetical protein
MKAFQSFSVLTICLVSFDATLAASVTEIDASNCATPSCTVTPTLLTSLTFSPTPVTILHAPGAITPVVVSFEPITVESLQPKSTVLDNPDGDGVLSLGSTTFSNLKATATTSYLVVPSDATDALDLHLEVAVEVDVEAEAQLFFGFDHNEAVFAQLAKYTARIG